jgi:flagellar L-ring protein precursor FlgH
MDKFIRMMWLALMASLLTACVPSTNIKQPLTARPQPKQAQGAEGNGAIFQAGYNERPMFEDRRARNVGDVLIISIVETTAASGKGSTSEGNSGSIALSTPTVTSGSAGGTTQYPLGMSASNAVKSANTSASTGSNSFTGSITVTVTEVLPNGNLRVAGEKQVAIRHAEEYVRFAGTVNPANISSSNTVQSTQVADVHIEYKGAQNLDVASITTMFNRFFMSILPF